MYGGKDKPVDCMNTLCHPPRKNCNKNEHRLRNTMEIPYAKSCSAFIQLCIYHVCKINLSQYGEWLFCIVSAERCKVFDKNIQILRDIIYYWLECCAHMFPNTITHPDGVTCHINLMHDDVIKCKHFLRYWPFVWGIHRSLVNSPHKDQWRGA